jgi:hypothetical protein
MEQLHEFTFTDIDKLHLPRCYCSMNHTFAGIVLSLLPRTQLVIPSKFCAHTHLTPTSDNYASATWPIFLHSWARSLIQLPLAARVAYLCHDTPSDSSLPADPKCLAHWLRHDLGDARCRMRIHQLPSLVSRAWTRPVNHLQCNSVRSAFTAI